MPRHIDDLELQPERVDGVALRQPHQRLGHALPCRAIHLCASGGAQGIDSTDVIGMVVRD
jgi:hypothetical protein